MNRSTLVELVRSTWRTRTLSLDDGDDYRRKVSHPAPFARRRRQLSLPEDDEMDLDKTHSDLVGIWSQGPIQLWLDDGVESFEAFQALLTLLEVTLQTSKDNYCHFSALMDSFDDNAEHIIKFLKQALPYLIDCDFTYHVDYIDTLLLYLTLYQATSANPEHSLLEAFVRETPDLEGFYLRQHGKRFEELFLFIHQEKTFTYSEDTKQVTVNITPHYLTCMHTPAKKVIVSNAPPIKLKRRRLLAKDKFECEVAAGGLVSGIRPSLESTDVWVSYLDEKVLDLHHMPRHMVPRLIREGVRVPARMRQSTSILRYSFSADESLEEHEYTDFLYEKAENDFMSLQKRLERFAKYNFIVNPLIILREDHEAFYNGISNGLFWPAFHDLPEYIIEEYKGPDSKEHLLEDWMKYVKVNFHFAIHAVRSCLQQDFLWIHDYHLFLVGGIIRALDPKMDCGFFLHIPFRISNQFMSEFRQQGIAVLKGLLGFTRVGFQSNRDTLNFVRLVQNFLPTAKVSEKKLSNLESLVFTIAHGHDNKSLTDVGTFPISIKTASFIEMAEQNKKAPETVRSMRSKIMGSRGKGSKLFLSVERFDYTKGIIERLEAIDHYLNQHPERSSLDVFYNIAASSRSTVSSYSLYQSKVLEMADSINKRWCSQANQMIVVIDQTNHPLEEVVQLYQAADVIVVTPIADGMNLVIKEAALCNPNAVFILSTGPGAENQLFDAGLGDCYLRLLDIKDKAAFADTIYRSINIPPDVAASCGQKLFEYTKQNDIDLWIQSFTDPQWTHQVIKPMPLSSLADFKVITKEIQLLRKTVADRLHYEQHIGSTFVKSMQNILHSLQRVQDTTGSANLSITLRNGLEVSVKVNLQQLQTDLRRDLKIVQLGPTTNVTESWVDCFINFSPQIESHLLLAQTADLIKLFHSLGSVDLLLIRSENIIAFPGQLQSLTSAFMLSRFSARFSSLTLLLSDDGLKDTADRLCFSESFSGGTLAEDGVQLNQDKPTVWFEECSHNFAEFKADVLALFRQEKYNFLSEFHSGIRYFHHKIEVPDVSFLSVETNDQLVQDLKNTASHHPHVKMETTATGTVIYDDHRVNLSVKDRLKRTFRLEKSMTNWLGRSVLLITDQKNDLELVEWMAKFEGAHVQVLAVGSDDLNIQQSKDVGLMHIASLDVLYAAAISVITRSVVTSI